MAPYCVQQLASPYVPYTSVGKTANKSAAGLTVTGLTPGASYSFIVRIHPKTWIAAE
jgi:hypothetical protein